MRIGVLTNEYPPDIYGGAGVHVEYLYREMAGIGREEHEIQVLAFGNQADRSPGFTVQGVGQAAQIDLKGLQNSRLLDTLVKNVIMAGKLRNVDVIHCHTWYTHLAGVLLRELLGAPLVLTTHSLEPHRPWKAEQMGAAYKAGSWIEKTAYQNADGIIAVSRSMKEDVQTLYGVPPGRIREIPNGIDLNQYRPTHDPASLQRYGIDPQRPFILFVGRITRQKGIIHLVHAAKHLHSQVQVVLCAGMPDTEEIREEMTREVERARKETHNAIIWIPHFLSKSQVVRLYSHAALFVCPSIYEPFGIINLEAMACGTPVVATAVGGIPEVVRDRETGWLVPLKAAGQGDFEPADPDRFARDLAGAIDQLLKAPDERKLMSEKARQWVETHFSWETIALRTLEFYRELTQKSRR